MKHLKIIIIFLICFIVFVLSAIAFDTNQNIKKLAQEIQQIDNEILQHESKYLEYLQALELNDPETNSSIVQYNKAASRELQQATFDLITLRVLAKISRLDATNQGVRALIDNLSGAKNRREMLLPQKAELLNKQEQWKMSFGAKLLNLIRT